jgi:hypothetical protein
LKHPHITMASSVHVIDAANTMTTISVVSLRLASRMGLPRLFVVICCDVLLILIRVKVVALLVRAT